MDNKKDLKLLTREELLSWFKKNNIKTFRAKQVFNWLYKNNVSSLSEMNNLPAQLINKLEKISYITNLRNKDKLTAQDGTIKYLWELADGNNIESVYIPFPRDNRYSVCISTQVGCAMGCKFCATALMGLNRNLTAAEIVDQVLKIKMDVENDISNVVFMGMGEPLDNIEQVLRAVEILNDNKGMNIGARKITISTSGVVPGIRRLAVYDKQIGLAVSLNAPNNRLRDKMMPINKKYPLSKLISAVKEYINKTKRRVTFEYVLVKGVNDSLRCAEQLSGLLSGILCHVNLIPVNPVPELKIERPSLAKIKKFKNILLNSGINATVRKERGTGIKAACGQLRYTEEKGGIR